MTKIVVVEDDREMSLAVCGYLEEKGYEVVALPDGSQLEQHLEGTSLLILDLQLPGQDGLELLRQVRGHNTLPILILSARADGQERVVGLEMGADDFLGKPFLPRELLARVEAVLRRARLPAATQATGFSLDTQSRHLRAEGTEVALSPIEFRLIQVLMQTPDRSFTRPELIALVWDEPEANDTRRVDLMVSKLRAKLAEKGIESPIQSVWGVGYRYVGNLK